MRDAYDVLALTAELTRFELICFGFWFSLLDDMWDFPEGLRYPEVLFKILFEVGFLPIAPSLRAWVALLLLGEETLKINHG